MATVSKSFTATGNGDSFGIQAGDKLTYAVSGTFVGTVSLWKTANNGVSWELERSGMTGTVSTTTIIAQCQNAKNITYRFVCDAYTSGTIVCDLADVSVIVQEFTDKKGNVILRLTEAGVEIPGNLSVTGTQTVTGNTTFTGRLYLPDGNASLPAIAFANDTDSGFYWSSNTVRLAIGGVLTSSVNDTGYTLAAGQFKGPDGNATAPTYTFANDADCGLYRQGTNVVRLGNNGVATAVFGADNSALLTSQITANGVGAKNGATVTAVEYGNDVLHKTVLTLTATPVPITSTTTANGFGGVKLYDFPQGHIRLHGCVVNISAIAVDPAEQDNFTDATPEGDVGIGSVIIANADALGTDATDDDMATGAAFTMSSFTAAVTCPPEASLNFNGTATALAANLNVLVDAADIDDDASTEVLVTGTVTLSWTNLGDY